MANGYLKKQFKGKGTVGSDMLEKLHQKHTDLSLMWLITGKGPMLEEQATASGQPQEEKGREYVISKDDVITLLRGQAAMMQRSLADKEKIILMLEAKLRRMQASQ
jgi:hypothetical protein